MLFYRAIVLALLGAAVCASNADAQDKKKDKNEPETAISTNLRDWATAQALPEEIDGVKIFRPMENDNGRGEVSELIEFPGLGQEDIFVAAMAYVVDNMDKETESIEAVDFGDKRFILRRQVEDDEVSPKCTYTYTVAFQAADEMLMFVEYDIEFDYKERSIISRHLPIEKLKPQSNKAHANIIEGFSVTSSRFIKALADYVRDNKEQKVTHWPDVKAGNVVKGMNATEVRLIGGRPVSIRKSGVNKEKWMFSNDFVVVFTDGVVTTVIQ